MSGGGSKPGERRGGRQKGSKNKRNELLAQAHRDVGRGMTPLQFMLKVMRDPKAEKSMRLDAAKSAARYVHPTLTAVSLHGANDDGSLTFNVNLIGADARA